MSDSIFFNYFKDKLRFSLLWKENEFWPVFKGIAQSFDQVKEDVLWLKKQYSPETLNSEDPEYPEFIDLFGQSRGLKQFPFENFNDYEIRVKNAYDYWSSAGKLSTLKTWLKTLGVNVYEDQELKEGELRAKLIQYEDKDDLASNSHLAHLDWSEIYVQFDALTIDKDKRKYINLIVNELKRASSLVLIGFNYKTVHDTKLESTAHRTRVISATYDQSGNPVLPGSKIVTLKKQILFEPKPLPKVDAILDDTVTSNSRDYVRTFDSDWFLDEPEDRPVKVRKAVN